jgi:MFS family permease
MSLDDSAVNLLFAVGGIGAIVAAFIGGKMADRFGGRQICASGMIVHTFFLCAWGIVGRADWLGYWLFGLSCIAAQIGIVGYSTWFSAYAPAAVRGRVLGTVGAIASIVSGFGPFAATQIRSVVMSSEAVGTAWQSVKLASSTPFIVSAVLAVFLTGFILRMPDRHESGLSQQV